MEYHTHVNPLARRQLAGWKLPDGVVVEVHLRLGHELPASPTSHLRRDPSWFDNQGMVYELTLIDPDNRLKVHTFLFQVFYHSDEQTLLVSRGVHLTGEGI